MSIQSNEYITAPVKMSDVTTLVGLNSALRGGEVLQEFKEKANYHSLSFPYCGYGSNSEGVGSSLTHYHTMPGNYIGGHGFYTKSSKASFKGQKTAAASYIMSMSSNLYYFSPAQRKFPPAPSNLGDWAGYRHPPYNYNSLVPQGTPYTSYYDDFPFFFEISNITFSDNGYVSVAARYSAYMVDIISTTLTQPKSIPSGYVGLNKMLAAENTRQLYLTIGLRHAPTQGLRKGGVEVWIANNGLTPLNKDNNSVEAKTISCTLGGVFEPNAGNWDDLSDKNKIWKNEILEVFPVLVAAPQTIPVESTGVTCKYCVLPAPLYRCKGGSNTGGVNKYCSANGVLQINYLKGNWYFGLKKISWRPLKSYGTIKEDGSFYYFSSNLTVFPESASSGSISGQSVIQARVQSYNMNTKEETSFQGNEGNVWTSWSNQIGKMYPTTIVPNSTNCEAGKKVRVQIAFTSPDNEHTVVEVNVELPTNTDDTTLVNFFI